MDHRVFSLPLNFRCFSPSRFLEVWEREDSESEEEKELLPRSLDPGRVLLLLLEESDL